MDNKYVHVDMYVHTHCVYFAAWYIHVHGIDHSYLVMAVRVLEFPFTHILHSPYLQESGIIHVLCM